jgi:lysophospholipid hydrolase
MSYAWILPPICDPTDGQLLMDGCYVNNVPGDVMLRSACSHIIVVDVTAPDDIDLTNYGDTLSGWWMLWKRWVPFTSPVKIPTQNEIQGRLAFCSHYKNLEALKSNPHYEYIFPPVGHFSSAKFSLFAEIQAAGYHHGTTLFYGLKKAGRRDREGRQGPAAPSWLPTADRARQEAGRGGAERRDSGSYTFTDLSQMVLAGGGLEVALMAGKDRRGRRREGGDSQEDEDSEDTEILL